MQRVLLPEHMSREGFTQGAETSELQTVFGMLDLYKDSNARWKLCFKARYGLCSILIFINGKA